MALLAFVFRTLFFAVSFAIFILISLFVLVLGGVALLLGRKHSGFQIYTNWNGRTARNASRPPIKDVTPSQTFLD